MLVLPGERDLEAAVKGLASLIRRPLSFIATLVPMQNIVAAFCFFAGAAVAWLWLRAAVTRLKDREQECAALRAALEKKEAQAAGLAAAQAGLEARLEETRKSAQEKLDLLEDARRNLADAFQALSADALRSNNQTFLDLARSTLEKEQQAARGKLAETVQPVRDTLARFETKIGEIETARVDAYAGLKQQVESLLTTQAQLRLETGRLVTALRAPSVRGRWGEIQLRRVVEMAGMLDHCDFTTQQTVNGDEGRLRPDLLVRLPGDKTVIVDAKAPLEAYLKAIEAEDEAARRGFLCDHAAQVRTHMTALARKSYWEQFESAPEFVVLFLPGECFFSAALEHDPALIEFGVDQRIILATPTTLIALLRAVAYGWRQENLARNAAEISRLGRDLYKRLADLTGHWTKLGKSLDRSVQTYNEAVGSLEARVLPAARKFAELDAGMHGVEIEQVVPIDKAARALAASSTEG